MKDSNMVKSVVKAMKIYEVLIEDGSPVSLSSLSRKLRLNISTVHRLINTFVKLGYIEQNEEGQYRLAFHSYRLADKISQNFNLKGIVRPYMEKIVYICNETTNLVVLEDYQLVYIDQVESTNMVRMFAGIGNKGAAYCTGSGKVLLAYLNNDKLDEYINVTDFISYTDNTIVDPDILKKEIREIREQGYALDWEEKERGVRCVAAPIFGNEDKLLGAISVSGPCSRITERYLKDTLVPLVKNKAREVTIKIKNGMMDIG